ncbi:MAG: hypothetical protein AAFQ37_03100 [Bacteroidota bacterium]
MKLFYLLLTPTLLLLISSCQRRAAYQNPNFAEETKDHQLIAILPYQLEYTGNLPKDWTPEKEVSVRRDEAIQFQRSLMSQLLQRTINRRSNYRVSFQSANTTNTRLSAADIKLVDSHLEDPTRLAEILGVDAVVQATVIKERYLSEEASLAIGVVDDILGQINRGNDLNLPRAGSRANTYSVDISVTLHDAVGQILYNDNTECNINWQTPPNEAVEKMNQRISRSFPYLTK